MPLAEGFDDIEALTVVNILRRAGIDVRTVGNMGNIVTSKSGVKVHTDERLIDLDDFSKYDGIVIPGCMEATELLMKSTKLMSIVQNFGRNNKFLGGICSAPLIFARAGLLNERRATIKPGLEKNLPRPRSDPVVVDGNVVTAQGKLNAVEFAFRIVEALLGKAKALELRNNMA